MAFPSQEWFLSLGIEPPNAVQYEKIVTSTGIPSLQALQKAVETECLEELLLRFDFSPSDYLLILEALEEEGSVYLDNRTIRDMLSPSSLSLDALEDYLKETVEDVSFHNKIEDNKVEEKESKVIVSLENMLKDMDRVINAWLGRRKALVSLIETWKNDSNSQPLDSETNLLERNTNKVLQTIVNTSRCPPAIRPSVLTQSRQASNQYFDTSYGDQSHSPIELNGSVFVVGGYDGDQPSHVLEVFNTFAKSWHHCPSMSVKRSYLAACLTFDGKIMVSGGHDGQRVLDSCEIFDPVEWNWSALPPMPSPRFRHSMITSSDGSIFVIGGNDGIERARNVIKFDPMRNNWTIVNEMSTARSGLAAVASSCLSSSS